MIHLDFYVYYDYLKVRKVDKGGKVKNKCVLFAVLVTLFSLETSCSGSAFTSSDVDTENFNGGIKSSKIVPIDAIQGENLDQSFGARFTKEKAMLLVSQYS